jgi:hypothetical protein
MEGALSLIGLAAAALLVVAIAVAWWEQTGQEAPAAAPPQPPRALAVDLHLDHLADLADLPDAAAPPPGDQATRDAVLGQAMARMAQPAPSSIAWMETQPMVAPGARAEPVPSSWG